MVSAGQLLAFAVASFIMIVIPGPSVLFVIGRALAHGRRTALATVVGNAAGVYVVAACVALGVGTLVERSAVVFTVVKLAGAGYLVWLGVKAVRQRGSLREALATAGAPPPRACSGSGAHPERGVVRHRPPVRQRLGPRRERRAVLVRRVAAAAWASWRGWRAGP